MTDVLAPDEGRCSADLAQQAGQVVGPYFLFAQMTFDDDVRSTTVAAVVQEHPQSPLSELARQGH
jgi:hypothetical protein